MFITLVSVIYLFGSLFNPTVYIRNDPGGRVIDYALKVAEYKKRGTKVIIDGKCSSACTLYLSIAHCVTERSVIGFHSSYGTNARSVVMANDYLLRSYPESVRKWIASQGGLKKKMIYLQGSTLKRLLPMCK